MVDLGQQTSIGTTTTVPQRNDVKARLGEMAEGDVVFVRDERMGRDLEDGLRR